MSDVYPMDICERERVSWKIRLRDESGTAGEWSEAYFEEGIKSWSAKWITGDYRPRKMERYPVDCFRRQFYVGAARVTSHGVIPAAERCGKVRATANGRNPRTRSASAASRISAEPHTENCALLTPTGRRSL